MRLPVTLMRYAAGVTSVVDMGGPLWTCEVRDQASKTVNAPRVAVLTTNCNLGRIGILGN
jgi:hypothetical protein